MYTHYKVSKSQRNDVHHKTMGAISTIVDRYWKGDTNTSTPSTKKNIGTKQMVKKTYRKKSRKNRKIIKKRIPRAIAPATKLIKCKMSDYLAFTCTSGAIDVKTVNGTNIVDPYGTSSAQQPLGYDQWKTLYRTAYVLGCKVKLTVWNNDTTACVFGVTVMDKNQGTTALTNYEYYREVPKTRSRLLSPDVDHGYIVNQTSTKKALNVRNITDNDTLRTNLQSDTAPSETYYIHAWCQPINQAATMSSVPCVLDVEYLVLLTNPIIPARSTG